MVALEFDVAALYDSNIYATRRAALDDAVIRASGHFTATDDRGDRLLAAEAHAERNQHVDVSRESSNTFGARLHARTDPSRTQSVDAQIQYDRAIQSRADPEARASLQRSPRKIDAGAIEFSYAFDPARLGIEVLGAARSFNYLDPGEHDRDMRSYEGALRLSYHAAGPLQLFVQPYATRRDFIRRVDFSGVNRDATTIGAMIGVRQDLTGILRGRVGVGFFNFRPDDAALKPFTGFAANGEIVWTPRPRTSVTATIFSGDVATTRTGATGRHDTTFAVRLDQEARHNLLLNAALSADRVRYRGSTSANRSTWRLETGATYLVNRAFSIFLTASATRRSATLDINEFARQTVSLGVRFRR